MAITYTVRDIKRLAPYSGDDTSEGLAIVRADLTLASASDVGTTASASLVLSGSAITSSLGLGTAGQVLELLQANALGSASAHTMIIPWWNSDNNCVYFYRHGSASNATEFVEATSAHVGNGHRFRLTLLGRISS